MTLKAGPELYFGDADRVTAKWAAAARVLADASSKGATYVDVRLPERPVAGGVAPDTPGQPGPRSDRRRRPGGHHRTAQQAVTGTPVGGGTTTPQPLVTTPPQGSVDAEAGNPQP